MDDFSGGQHHGHGLDIIPGGSVFHCPHAAGIGGDVSAQGSEFFTRIGRIEHPVFQCIFGQGIQQDPGLYPHVHILFIVTQDLVHPGSAQYQPLLDRRGSSG